MSTPLGKAKRTSAAAAAAIIELKHARRDAVVALTVATPFLLTLCCVCVYA